ncbi:hypothetical protein N7539_003846 [Penicillium diatomitis]|uniref:Major facilitator superfamily (MFS) profile domain-containing protein n=1 Tax=Penicillium diatomitis TaxID=2819901 RepID=A0A9W9XD13_9EURO|nr:uncharacterized protein N7539_003846 [Penicillium diatomitis]KAJ5488956.1 hypothetical protein N7539_003846 [Penicillium diatomitis]
MALPNLGAFIEVERSSRVSSPPAAARRDKTHTSRSETVYELQDMQSQSASANSRLSKPSAAVTLSPRPTPRLLEDHQGSLPTAEAPDCAPDRIIVPWKTKWRVLSCSMINFGNGLNDSAPGALIPYIESHYGIGYAVVSLIFVTNALGFISAAPATHAIERQLGRSKSFALAMSLPAISYVIIICQPPFPVVVLSFLMLGFGVALNLALTNVYCANLPNSTTALSCLHGGYGLGGTVAPLFATAMVSRGIRWSLFYIVPLAFCLLNLIYAIWAFAGFEEDTSAEVIRPTSSRPSTASRSLSRMQQLKRAIHNRTTLLGALFIFAYQGAEVSTSGWVVSFLISYRLGDPSHVGYVSAGFWAGITVGRFLLVHPAARVGHKTAVMIMIAGAVAFQLMTWLIPNIVGDAVAVAILGLLLGPVFPSATAVFVQLLPRRMHMTSLSFISALGSSGGAVSPFITGLLAQHVGTMVLHPICIGLYGVMATSWLLLPKIVKRSD